MARRRSPKRTGGDDPLRRWFLAPASTTFAKSWGSTDEESVLAFQSAVLRHTRVNPKEALAAVEKVSSSDRGEMAPLDRARLDRLLAHACVSIGDFPRADEAYRTAWDGFRRSKNRAEMGATGIGWTNALTKMGRFPEAHRVAKRARDHISQRDRVLRARLDVNRANIYILAGREKEAIPLLRRARKALRAAALLNDAASVAYNLGYALAAAGQLKAARTAFEESAEQLRKSGLEIYALNAEQWLTFLDMMMGQQGDVLERVEQLSGRLAELGEPRPLALGYRMLAEFLLAVGILERAEAFASQSLHQYRELNMKADVASAAFLHGRVLAALGRRIDARVRFSECGQFWEETGNARARRRTDLEMASVLLARGETQDAMTLLRGAASYLSRADRRVGHVRCRQLMAHAYLQMRQYKRARRLAEAAYDDAKSYPLSLERPHMAVTVARCCAQANNVREALKWVRRAVSQTEKIYLALGTQALRGLATMPRESLFRDVVEIVLQVGGASAPRTAMDLLSRARSPQLVEDLLRGRGKLPQDLQIALAKLRDELLDATGPEEGDVRTTQMHARAQELQGALQRRLSVAPAVVRQALRARFFREWSRRLEGRSLVLFDQDRSGWCAYVVGSGRRVRRVELPLGRQSARGTWMSLRLLLEQSANLPKERRSIFLRETCDEANAALVALRTAFLDPLDLDVQRETLMIAHGPLQGIPLEAAAMVEQDVTALGPMARWPHPAVVRRRGANRERRAHALMLHDGSRETAAEARHVARTLEKHGHRASLGSTRGELLGARHPLGVVHIAAHGAYHRDQWFLNGIRLRDGWLGFDQIIGAPVRGSLMSFSTCESGLPNSAPASEHDGWMSAGLSAGAREMVLSLWKIDHASSTAFAAAFYKRWCRGMRANRAAHEARAEVRRRHPHPFSWGSLVALG